MNTSKSDEARCEPKVDFFNIQYPLVTIYNHGVMMFSILTKIVYRYVVGVRLR